MSDETNEIWELYADEGQQSLQAAEEALLALKKSPTDANAIAGLFRSVHTFKGNSRVMGLSIIESRAHVAEDLIGVVRDEGAPLDNSIIDLLLEMIDVLNGMLVTTCKSQHDAKPEESEELVERLRQKLAQCRNEMSQTESIEESAPTEIDYEDDFFASVTSVSVSEDGKQVQVHEQLIEIVETVISTENSVELENIDSDTTAIIFEKIEEALADNPIYQKIFEDMANEVLLEMKQILAEFPSFPDTAQVDFHTQAERLHFAAEQLGLQNWEVVLLEFLSRGFTETHATALFNHLSTLLKQDFQPLILSNIVVDESSEITHRIANTVNADDEIALFFSEIQTPLNLLKIAYDVSDFDRTQFFATLEQIKTFADQLEFTQLVSLIDDFVTRSSDEPLNHQNIQDFLFLLFATLAETETMVLEKYPQIDTHAKTLLGYLCSKQVFDNLMIISEALAEIKNKINVEDNCNLINQVLRKVYYVCQYHSLETAALLSMSLIDLFARVANENLIIDGFILRITKSFVTAIESVLNGLQSCAKIEKLLDNAMSAAFISCGVVSQATIEARLGLPESFRKILTPDSLKLAAESLEENQNFYIVRTDLNSDEELAANFLTWVESGIVTVISNVTVFEEDYTLFDFLLATSLNATQLSEALIALEPNGNSMLFKRLFITESLINHEVADESPNLSEDIEDVLVKELESLPSSADGLGKMSGNMLESIGELVTNQAQMGHLLRDLVEEDLAKNIEAKLSAVDGQWSHAKDDIQQYLSSWQDKIEKLIQIEVQTNAQMGQLQEESIAGRMRPATQLLEPLVPFVENIARQQQRLVDFSTKGEDISLDFNMMENLKTPLHTLLTFCLTQSVEMPQQRIVAGKNNHASLRLSLIENSDHVKIIIEDDGAGIDMKLVNQRALQLGLSNQLDAIFNSAYGMTCNNETGENGVDFAKLREALQLHRGNLWIENLSTGGLRFTLTMSLSMMLLEGMVVRINAVHYVIPIDAIQRIIRIDTEDLMHISADGGQYMLHLENNETVPVQFLKGNHQENSGDDDFSNEEKQLFVVIGKGQQRIAIRVSELIGQQNVLSRPLQGYLSYINGVIGCTLLGSGDVGLVLDVNNVINAAH